MSIRRIAKLANVSTSTVSRVINNHPYVAEDKRQRVLKVMKDIDYVPNKNAINLSSGQSGIIGLVVPYTRNSCYDQLIESILEEATLHDKKIMLLPTYFDKNLEKDYYALLRDKTVDGIIVTSKTQDDVFLQELSQFGPVVTTEKTKLPDIPSVYPDRLKTYHTVFSYLAELKSFKKIVVSVSRNKQQSYSTELKMTVFSHYFPEVDVETAFLAGTITYDDGYQLGIRLFNYHKEPLIIYANGDEVAAGFFKASQKAGLIMGKDFYLLGEDNQLFSELLAIDTVDFHLKEVGKKAVRHLISHSKKHEIVSCSLIKR
ncbi:LacI family DNA-binding transcriptional regulator [Vagococcus sp.]|uniref:LacI family DNA-binding transcriptional regulator n=1 Tax=Vagococcus sp. TaxID=1933889 RepID=UPI002FC92191